MGHRKRLTRHAIAAVLASGCLSACAAAPATAAPSGPAPSLTCGTWLCQTNSASMGQRLFFHELDASGQRANDAGIRYRGFHDASGAPLTLSIDGDAHRIVGTDAQGAALRGDALVGAVLVLEDTSTRERFDVAIKAVGEIDFWVHPREKVPTYVFEYRPQVARPGDPEGRRFQPLCTGRDVPAEWNEKSPGTTTQLALIFTGDRYDPRTKTVTVGPSDWFNVACAGSALAKMHLLRHTYAGSFGEQDPTDVEQRQAMLKMLTDDICGTGYSFTVDGEAVFYADRKGWHPFAPAGSPPASVGSIEAIWTKDGAICLDEARRLAEEPTIAAAIAAECRTPLPTCQSLGYDLTNWSAKPDHYGISANP
ncbi:MAG TPA: ADYC domain-containing protein [Kofleriaceae bacterium]|nr:ADYC domain-containing protein [Kofleriaceae bacterium]